VDSFFDFLPTNIVSFPPAEMTTWGTQQRLGFLPIGRPPFFPSNTPRPHGFRFIPLRRFPPCGHAFGLKKGALRSCCGDCRDPINRMWHWTRFPPQIIPTAKTQFLWATKAPMGCDLFSLRYTRLEELLPSGYDDIFPRLDGERQFGLLFLFLPLVGSDNVSFLIER